MQLRTLAVDAFRNLKPQRLSVGQGITFVLGGNGAGKTNLLEAVAVAGNLASFRNVRPAALIQRGCERYRLLVGIEHDGTITELRQEVTATRPPGRSLFRGERRLGAAEYLGLFPVVSLSAMDREFLDGAPEQRRRFLDRLAFVRHPEALAILQTYRRALRQRNASLAAGADARTLDPFEYELAGLGARVISLRMEALAALEPLLEEELEALGWSLSRPNLRYNCPDRLAVTDPTTLAQRLRAALLRARQRERVRGHTIVGPHRHDLSVILSGVSARDVLSAGQSKLLVTALKLAFARMVERKRGCQPITVFDDVDAEFDAAVLERVFERLSDGRQALLSSPHEERLLPYGLAGARWRVSAGVVTAC